MIPRSSATWMATQPCAATPTAQPSQLQVLSAELWTRWSVARCASGCMASAGPPCALLWCRQGHRQGRCINLLQRQRAWWAALPQARCRRLVQARQVQARRACVRGYQLAIRPCVRVGANAGRALQARNAFCAVRPPGHHAGPTGVVTCDNEPHGSHGFCLLNNVAIGGAYALNVHRHHGASLSALTLRQLATAPWR